MGTESSPSAARGAEGLRSQRMDAGSQVQGAGRDAGTSPICTDVHMQGSVPTHSSVPTHGSVPVQGSRNSLGLGALSREELLADTQPGSASALGRVLDPRSLLLTPLSGEA